MKMNNRGVEIKMSWVEKNRKTNNREGNDYSGPNSIYIYVYVYMYIYYISIHMYYIVCDHKIMQAMQFVEISFYLALLHQHKFTKLY